MLALLAHRKNSEGEALATLMKASRLGNYVKHGISYQKGSSLPKSERTLEGEKLLKSTGEEHKKETHDTVHHSFPFAEIKSKSVIRLKLWDSPVPVLFDLLVMHLEGFEGFCDFRHCGSLF